MSNTPEDVIVEVLRPDGSTSMWIGRFVSRSIDSITLVDATWIVSTGRRHQFLSGDFTSEELEWEPHPAEAKITIEAPILWWGPWAHGLTALRDAR